MFFSRGHATFKPLFGPSVRRVGLSVGPSVHHKVVFRGFLLLPTRPRLMLSYIRPCSCKSGISLSDNIAQFHNPRIKSDDPHPCPTPPTHMH